MNKFDLLSETDKEFIEWYIESYAIGDGEYSTVHYDRRAPLRDVLRPWNEAKSFGLLGKIFGDKLEVVLPVSHSVPESEKINALRKDSRITSYANEFYEWIRNLPDSAYKNGRDDKWNLEYLVSYRVLAANEYDGDTVYIADPSKGEGHWIAINKGCKPVKIIGKLNQAYHISENFEAFRIAHSMVLNTAKIKGDLHISIHPMDFMTMSDNDCDWDSCMSWANRGSYRQGTVEMMNSEYVVVAFLTSSTLMRRFNYTWNNKKWRSLYIVDRDIITNIKGYPYQLPEIDKVVIQTLAQMIHAAEPDIIYRDVYSYDYENGFPVGGDHDKSVELDFQTGHMYNDFGTITHYGCVREGATFGDFNNIRIDYSGVAECMWCGGTDPGFGEDELLVCDCCEDSVRCDCCGEISRHDDLYETASGDWVCESCIAEYYDKDINEEYVRTDDLQRVYVIPDELAEYAADRRLDLLQFDYDLPGFNYNMSGYEPWGQSNPVEKELVENFECECLKEGCHVHIVEESRLLGRPRFHPYVLRSELRDNIARSYVWQMGYSDRFMELDIYLEGDYWWASKEAFVEANGRFGEKQAV